MQIDISNSLQAGVQGELQNTWRQEFPIYQEQQEKLLRFAPPITIRNASYVLKTRAPFPRPWKFGAGRTHQQFTDKVITCGIVPYEITIDWNRYDLTDDQVGDLLIQAQTAAKGFLQLPDRLTTEYFEAAASYNHSLQLCEDGVALFSATNGDGDARYNVTGGNIVNGTGTEIPNIITDIQSIWARFLGMKTPYMSTVQPLHDPRNVQYENMLFIIPPALTPKFEVIANTQTLYGDLSMNTSTGNVLFKRLNYATNSYLSDDEDYYCILDVGEWRPFLYRAPGSVEAIVANQENSDRARETGTDGIFNTIRTGLSPWCHWVAIKLDN